MPHQCSDNKIALLNLAGTYPALLWELSHLNLPHQDFLLKNLDTGLVESRPRNPRPKKI